MQKSIPLDELQFYKMENIALKERMLRKDLEMIQKEQFEIMRSLYPGLVPTDRCIFDPSSKTLTIESVDKPEVTKDSLEVVNGTRR